MNYSAGLKFSTSTLKSREYSGGLLWSITSIRRYKMRKFMSEKNIFPLEKILTMSAGNYVASVQRHNSGLFSYVPVGIHVVAI